MSENKQELIKEGIEYYRYMTPYKKKCLPYLPCGYASVGDDNVCVGIMADQKLFLGVWNLKGSKQVSIPLQGLKAKSAVVGYPKKLATDFVLKDNVLTVDFTEAEQARLFEIDLAE